MNAHSQATVPLSATSEVDLTQKQWAASSTASPTECTAEDDDSSSSSSSDDDDDKTPPKPAGESADKSTTAGLFIQTDKPLPLNPQRTVPLPIHRLWKRHGETSKANASAPDILRKTGSGTAQFSNEESGPDQHQQEGRASPRRTKSLDDSALMLGSNGGCVVPRSGGRRGNAQTLARSKSVADAEEDDTNVDFDEEFHCEGQSNNGKQRGPVIRRAQSEIETDDYVNYSSMNSNNVWGPFAFFRGRR